MSEPVVSAIDRLMQIVGASTIPDEPFEAAQSEIAALRAENTLLQSSLRDKHSQWQFGVDVQNLILSRVSETRPSEVMLDSLKRWVAERDTYREIAGELGKAGEALYRIVWFYKGGTSKEALEQFKTTLASWTEIEKGK